VREDKINSENLISPCVVHLTGSSMQTIREEQKLSTSYIQQTFKRENSKLMRR